jgi:adenylate cyclase
VKSGLPSAGKRFFLRLGFSLGQAAIWGSLVGLWAYFRPERSSPDGAEPSLMQRLQRPLEALELQSYDWRARERALRSEPVSEVALVTLDDETLANARQDGRARVAAQPFPRELLGQVLKQVSGQGAALTVVDLPFSDLSPRGDGEGGDDLRFRRLIGEARAPTVLGLSASEKVPPPALKPLRPYLARVAPPSPQDTVDVLVQRALAERRVVYAVPEGSRTSVWVGVSSLEEGRAVARRWLPGEEALVREFSAPDRAYQVDAEALAVRLAEVQVPGVDPERLAQVRWLVPPVAPLLAPAQALGFRELSPDRDGVVRGTQLLRAYVSPRGDRHVLPSIALAAAQRAVKSKGLRYEKGRLWLTPDRGIPMAPDGYSLITWNVAEAASDGRGTFVRSTSVWPLIRDVLDAEGGLPAHGMGDLSGHQVWMTDLSQVERVKTPVGAAVAPGAVNAQVLENLLVGTGVTRVDPKVDLVLTFVLAFVGAFLALSLSGWFNSLLGAFAYFAGLAAAMGGYLAVARHVFLTRQEWVAVAGPLLALVATFSATTLYALRHQARMAAFLESVLGRYVSPEVARQVLGNVALMRPERREITLCVCDLAGFNALFEALSPFKLVSLLNDYFTEMTAIVRRFGGQVEYGGDALVAFFGAPVRTERHALQACQAALAMRKALKKCQPTWEKKYGFKVEFGVGVYTGEVLVGDMGSPHRSSYTVMGEPVALAELVERQNRVFGTHVLVGERTQELTAKEFAFREVDGVSLREQRVRLFELLGPAKELGRERRQELERYHAALARFRMQDFEGAKATFAALSLTDPVAAQYLERCEHHLKSPPGAKSDGASSLREPA